MSVQMKITDQWEYQFRSKDIQHFFVSNSRYGCEEIYMVE